MYNTMRKIHLWVGLILAIFLLAEAITGLILAEPWLIGQSPQEGPARMSDKSQVPGLKTPPPDEIAQRPDVRRDFFSSPYSIAKGLHEGKYAAINFKWLVDLVAIGIIFLTVTGVYLSITRLRARTPK
ncbi:PepSY-associated TM helix domain-containing protein [Sporomusa acidovorans]|uniref:PepSY-associated TM helix n=1 Tax=Sporomusa acidovorans (strain ATCC 49682 / DSM 3132 / Mol) TaxID=1123286 RepID=A0ABZ3JBX5_SPOA4|nr:PepSY-associated TM helix domain-containing protein [Sporomusa acidovorans]OZC21614.1 PepSY-associated TM helix [Sporomusa acidovorans DSM 3132]SDD62819.1 hypothetical protein SAMN04488499_1002255 [Sporomusa acidovorans]